MPAVPVNEKYSRHFLISGFDPDAQERLLRGRVLVIGAGGLGSPVLMYLSGAGVGHLGIIENDSVAVSNIHRQILYETADVGKRKAQKAYDRIRSVNEECDVSVHDDLWTKKNAFHLSEGYDVLIDCTDNHASRYLTDEVSRTLDIPFVYGAIHGFEGQLSVFNYKGGKSYTEVFPKKRMPDERPVGVIGPLAGVIGSLQAAEAMKILTGIGDVLSNKILFISLKYNRFHMADL
jgi:adenylyltransferase/sulfurtransferase